MTEDCISISEQDDGTKFTRRNSQALKAAVKELKPKIMGLFKERQRMWPNEVAKALGMYYFERGDVDHAITKSLMELARDGYLKPGRVYAFLKDYEDSAPINWNVIYEDLAIIPGNSIILNYKYNDEEVPISFTDKGYFNATQAAKFFGKRPDNWLQTEHANRYIADLRETLTVSASGKTEAEQNQLVITKNGGDNYGTWLHPKLAIIFARWLDVKFERWCDEQIVRILHGEEPDCNPKVPEAMKSWLDTSILALRDSMRDLVEGTNYKFLEQVEKKIHEAVTEAVKDIKAKDSRSDFPKLVQDIWLKVVQNKFDMECPCGCKNIIADKNGWIAGKSQAAHFNDRDKNGLTDGARLCISCHAKHRETGKDRSHLILTFWDFCRREEERKKSLVLEL